MKKLILAAAFASAASFLVPGAAQAEAVVVGTDEAGDWGADIDPELGPIGSALGQDLVSAAIEIDDEAGVANFVIGVTELPAIGGTPEATRYTWNMTVGTQALELDGKFTNYSRGTCDPTAGTCPPPRDPGMAPFLLRGNCRATGGTPNVTLCQEFAKVSATFDVDTATITIPIPLTAIDPNGDCLDITAGTGLFGGFISAAPSAFFTNGSMPMDVLEDMDLVKVNTCVA